MEKAKRRVSEDLLAEWIEEDELPSHSARLSDDELSQKYADIQLRVVRTTMDFTLHHLKSSLRESTYINLTPGYQRRVRWDRKKKSQLIESFLLNIPVPPLFLYENDYNQYEVMDGRQRLEAISDFLDDKFKLSGMEFWPELNNKFFRDLPSLIQRGLLRRTISAVVLLAETFRGDGDFDIRMVLFRRLNTGGINLNPQELRNAAYPGAFNSLIKRLARSDIFTSIWGVPPFTAGEEESPPRHLSKNIIYQSMMDCELVLRFFAIRSVMLGQARGSLRSILDKTMKNNMEISISEKTDMEELFLRSLSRVTDMLGIDFLILPGTQRPSRAIYDAFTVAVSLHLDQAPARAIGDLRLRLNDALSDDRQYEILVARGNTVEAIVDRVSLASRILFE